MSRLDDTRIMVAKALKTDITKNFYLRWVFIVAMITGSVPGGYYTFDFLGNANNAFKNSATVVEKLVNIDRQLHVLSERQKKTIIIDDLINLQSFLAETGKVWPEMKQSDIEEIYKDRRIKEIIEKDNKRDN